MSAMMNREQTSGSRDTFAFGPWKELPRLSPVRNPLNLTAEFEVPPIERVIALIALILLSPVFLMVAASIKIASPGGPVFYKQIRIGVDRRRKHPSPSERRTVEERRTTPGIGREFRIVKFRTMIPNAETYSGPTWASANDPRIFPLGRLLRLTRLDELPQLVNVAVGEMRLIGPRPERPYFVNQLAITIPEYVRRQRVPPGITGLAQVERKYDASVDDVRTKVKYDLFYVDNRSTRLDLKIVLKTIDVVVRGRGAR
jgi:lipopolysaccharide/colanic/teichoic acid biosynthesis glycosyltransferase